MNKSNSALTGAQLFASAFRRHGVKCVFGQSIPSAFFLAAPEFGIRQLGYRTENAGAAMADAYARISGHVAVVAAQNGPAATLLVPGLAEAFKASIPVVALVQDVHRAQVDKNAFQELDHLDLFRGCTKWIRRVASADRIDDYVDMAFTVASSGRPGPVVLLAPFDLFEDMAQQSGRTAQIGKFPLDRPVADPAQIQRAAALLCEAKRPLVVAGGGVHSSQACAELAALQDAASLPVATTTMGKGAVDERHPLSVGIIGYFMGQRGMAKGMRHMVDEADVVLLIGTRTNQNGTDSWTLFRPGKTFIHLDIDPAEIGRNYEALRLLGDAKTTLAALTQAMTAQGLKTRSAGRAGFEAAIAAGRKVHAAEAQSVVGSAAAPIRPERIMGELQNVLTDRMIVVSDASYASIWTSNYLTSQRAGARFLTPRGLAGLGWGLPFALGAKAAAPESPVICVAGDGGFAHVWSELETSRRLDLPVTIIILNNQILGYQLHAETLLFGKHTDVCNFQPVDHAAIARACGCEGIRIEEPDRLLPAIKQALASPITTLLDVVTDPNAFPPVTAFDKLK